MEEPEKLDIIYIRSKFDSDEFIQTIIQGYIAAVAEGEDPLDFYYMTDEHFFFQLILPEHLRIIHQEGATWVKSSSGKRIFVVKLRHYEEPEEDDEDYE